MNARRPGVVAVTTVAAVATALLVIAIGAWQYGMPPALDNPWGLNPQGVSHFRQALHVPPLVMSDARFRAGLVALLIASFVAYGALCAAVLAAGGASVRFVVILAAATAAMVAVSFPPSLSSDVYPYVGYARLALVHHQNPYLATQLELVHAHDPTAPFVRWGIASPYGPLWTLICMLPVALLPGATLFVHVVIMKLFAAGGLLLLAFGGRRLAERLAPGRGDVVFAVLALNPFLLIEGPGNGHNDLVMIALALWALAELAGQRPRRALALIGLGAAVKFIPLALAPWVVARELRQRRELRFLAVAILLVVGPLAAAYAPFWRGAATLVGVVDRWHLGQDAGRRWGGAVLTVLAYAGVSPWVIAGDARRVVVGWIGASSAALIFLVGVCFPWYAVWPFPAAVALQTRRGWLVAALLFALAASLTLRYAAALPGS